MKCHIDVSNYKSLYLLWHDFQFSELKTTKWFISWMVKYCSATVHMYFLNIPGFSEVQGIIAKVAYAKKKNRKDLAAYVYGRT